MGKAEPDRVAIDLEVIFVLGVLLQQVALVMLVLKTNKGLAHKPGNLHLGERLAVVALDLLFLSWRGLGLQNDGVRNLLAELDVVLVDDFDLVGQVGDVLPSDVVAVFAGDLVIEETVFHCLLVSFLLEEVLHQVLSEILEVLQLSEIIAKADLRDYVFEQIGLIFIFVEYLIKLPVDLIGDLLLALIGEEAVEPDLDLIGDQLLDEASILLVDVLDQRVVPQKRNGWYILDQNRIIVFRYAPLLSVPIKFV